MLLPASLVLQTGVYPLDPTRKREALYHQGASVVHPTVLHRLVAQQDLQVDPHSAI